MDIDLVNKGLNKLKDYLGSDYVNIISNNMTYLEYILSYNS